MEFLETLCTGQRNGSHTKLQELTRVCWIMCFILIIKQDFGSPTIHCDNEFCPLINQLQDICNAQMNYANPQEYVPEAKRNDHVIKEQF
jgi:hypothetical protein